MMSKRWFFLLTALLLGLTLAQDSQKRIITISYDGGTRSAENLRYGPYFYSHPDPKGIKAEVSNLFIEGQEAEFRAPEDTLMADAQGQREADFYGGVEVNRDRLNATGLRLAYSEATGLGVMTAEDQVAIFIEPEEDDEEAAEIFADDVTFDVDTDMSVSRGNVRLLNGNTQAQADEITYEELRDLAKLNSENTQVTARRVNEDGELTITADVLRVFTDTDRLYASGNVTLIDGDITTTGDEVFFDDEISRAEIFGSPAVSIDERYGVRLEGQRLEQRTDIDVVQVLDNSVPSEWRSEDFMLTGE